MLMGHGKCPKCEKPTDHLEIDRVTIGDKLNGPLWHGYAAICPSCKTIVSAGIDPIAIKTDIVKEMCKALRVAVPKT